MNLFELLQYDFIRNALLMAVLVSIPCAILGTFIVVRRLVFIAGGLSHVAFGGLGLFHFLGLPPLFGGFIFAGLTALILGISGQVKRLRQDALIGLLWSAGMALGILFISLTPGYAPNLMTYLFGNIITISIGDLGLALGLNLVIIIIIILFFKEFVAVSFDDEFAALQGVPVRLFMTILLLLVSVSIVLLIRLVGIILVMALLTVPPLIGMQLARRFSRIMTTGVISAMVISLAGLVLSFWLDLPSGPIIVVTAFCSLGLITGIGAIIRRISAASE